MILLGIVLGIEGLRSKPDWDTKKMALRTLLLMNQILASHRTWVITKANRSKLVQIRLKTVFVVVLIVSVAFSLFQFQTVEAISYVRVRRIPSSPHLNGTTDLERRISIAKMTAVSNDFARKVISKLRSQRERQIAESMLTNLKLSHSDGGEILVLAYGRRHMPEEACKILDSIAETLCDMPNLRHPYGTDPGCPAIVQVQSAFESRAWNLPLN